MTKWANKRTVWVGVGTLALIAAVVLGVARPWADETGAAAQQAELYARAIALVENSGGDAAAVVNGQPIPLAKVKAYNLFLQAGHGPMSADQALPYATTEKYLDLLIDNELLYQEAERRGLLPTDAQVLEFAKYNSAALAASSQGDSNEAKALATALESVKGSSFDPATYSSEPDMLDAFRRTMAIGALRTQVIDSTLRGADTTDPGKREAVVSDLISKLRQTASIQILVTTP